MEAALVHDATEDLSAPPASRTLVHRKTGPGEKSGLICAGSQTLVRLPLDPSHGPLAEEISGRLATDAPGLLVVDANGLRMSDDDLWPGGAQSLFTGGDSFLYEEQLRNRRRAALIGGGHCAAAVADLLGKLGYFVTMIERRRGVYTFVETQAADRKLVVGDFVEAGPLIDLPELTHVIVLTSDYPSDVRALLGCRDVAAPYIGVMGSEAKLAAIARDLREEGVRDEWISDLRAPIGLAMSSNTPHEIAVSIAAELLTIRAELFPETRPNDAMV